MTDTNITDPIFALARDTPHAIAIIEDETPVSYQRLCSGSRRAAGKFRQAGWQAGDIVGVSFTGSRTLHLTAALALARSGIAQIALPPDEAPALLRARIDRVKVKGVVADYAAAAQLGLPLVTADAGWLQRAEADTADVRDSGGERVWLIAETSGTTGKPKLTGITHAMERVHYQRNEPFLSLRPGERFLNLTGLHFTMGIKRALWVLSDGATHVFTPRGLGFAQLSSFIDARNVTYLNCVPLHLHYLLEQIRTNVPRLPGLRVLRSSSAALPVETLHEVCRRISPNVFVCYGVSEIGPVSVALPEMLAAYPDSVGCPMGDIEAQIVDAQDNPVPTGTAGIVRMRGSAIRPAYLQQGADDVAQVFRHGWCYPGDAGVINAEGLLFLKGRADEVMNFDGVMVGPAEIEAVLMQYPEITAAAAFALPSPAHQELPAAVFISSRPLPIAEIAQFCQQRLGIRTPRALFQVEQIPKNPIGKVLRRELVAMALGRLKNAPAEQ